MIRCSGCSVEAGEFFDIRIPAVLATRNLKRAKATPFTQKKSMITKNIGMLLLAIYLILIGITTLFHVGIPAIVTGILALIAGILILIGR